MVISGDNGKEITFEEFSKAVSELWATEAYTYGSVQYPAAKVRDEFIAQGVTNAKEMYEIYRKAKGESFWYAGD